jgi:ankyrin repeat protein
MSLLKFLAAAANDESLVAKVKDLLEKHDVDNLRNAAARGDTEGFVTLFRERVNIKAMAGKLSATTKAEEDNKATVEKLLEKHFDINGGTGGLGNALYAASYSNDSTLHRSGEDANENRIQIIKWLIEKGADINAKSGMYGNALTAASATGKEAIVQLLLEKGANPNAGGQLFRDALGCASAKGHVEIVKLLLENKAHGIENAHRLASARGHPEIVKLLLKSVGDTDASSVMRSDASAKGCKKQPGPSARGKKTRSIRPPTKTGRFLGYFSNMLQAKAST